jgi:hypothetical protein
MVADDQVVIGACCNQTNAEIVAWSRVAVSTQPVRTEPVAS